MASTPVNVKRTPPARIETADTLRNLRTEMDRLFDRFGFGFAMPTLQRMFDVEPVFTDVGVFGAAAPAVDITEDETAWHIAAELPGLEEKDVEVSLGSDTLTLKGEKRQEKETKDKNTYLSERSWGLFERSFALPEGVDRDAVAAEFAKGVLTITLPKKPEVKQAQKKIEVKAAV